MGLLDGLFGGGGGGGLFGSSFGSNSAPYAADLGQSSPGFMGDLSNRLLSSPLVPFGLALASGKTPQEGFGNAANALFMRQKLAQANLTGDIKEYQYALSQGFRGSFQDWQKANANLKQQFGLNPQGYEYTDPKTGEKKYGVAQFSTSGALNTPQAPGGGEWARPQMQIVTPQGVQTVPRSQSTLGGGLTTSTTDDMGRPIVPEPPAPIRTPQGNYYPKDYVGPEEQKKVGAQQGDEYGDIQKQSINAVAMKNTFSRMGQLNDQAYQGAGAPGVQYARSMLATFGVDPGKVPAGEELTMLSNRLVLDATGGSLGNQISNADRDFISATNPNLANTKEGRAQMIDTGMKLANRKIEVAKIAREYRDKNGSMKGFNEYIADWAEKNPLFPQGGGRSSGSGTTKSGIKWTIE